MRNPKRTAATASALMIGVALIGFITILAASTRTSIDAAIDRAFTGDFVVNPGSFGSGGLDPALAKRIGELPEVKAATGVRSAMVEIGGSTQQVLGVDPETAFALVDVKPLQGAPAALGKDAIGVFEDKAKDDGLSLGDTVDVTFKDSGVQRLRVAMIYGEDQPAGNYLLGFDAYEPNVSEQYDALVFVQKADGVSADRALDAVNGVAKGFPGADVQDRTAFKQEQTKPVNQILGLVYALLGLAIVIALLGIGNTLALSVLERTREVGLLRSVGMTRSQLRSTIRWESVVIALQGSVLGMVIGTFFGWALVKALNDQGIDRFTIPFGTLLIVLVLAAFAGVGAAILPARRAAKLDVLRAVEAT
jgi:putative ABC transport system permease protein